MKVASPKDLQAETLALLDYFEQRGLDAREAVGSMGFALTALLPDEAAVHEFTGILLRTVRRSWESKSQDRRQ